MVKPIAMAAYGSRHGRCESKVRLTGAESTYPFRFADEVKLRLR